MNTTEFDYHIANDEQIIQNFTDCFNREKQHQQYRPPPQQYRPPPQQYRPPPRHYNPYPRDFDNNRSYPRNYYPQPINEYNKRPNYYGQRYFDTRLYDKPNQHFKYKARPLSAEEKILKESMKWFKKNKHNIPQQRKATIVEKKIIKKFIKKTKKQKKIKKKKKKKKNT